MLQKNVSPLREQRNRSRKEYDAGPQSAENPMGFGIVCIINIDHRSEYFLGEEDVDIFSTTNLYRNRVGGIILVLWIIDFYCL